VDWVDVDNVNGIYQVTQHLIDAGHIKIGFIGIHTTEAFAKERHQGYVNAMNDHKIDIDSSATFFMAHSIEGIRSRGHEILENISVTAFVCASDVLAYGLIEIARELSVNVPEDLSVVGFDGFMFNRMSIPNITTVIQPVYMIGRKIAHVLLERLKDTEMPSKQITIPTFFEKGQSVKYYKSFD
jgi:DNA-binding LacI/PurR family transcriptional regulator